MYKDLIKYWKIRFWLHVPTRYFWWIGAYSTSFEWTLIGNYVYGTIYMKIIIGFKYTATSPVTYLYSLIYESTLYYAFWLNTQIWKKTSGNTTNARYKNLVHQYNSNGCSVICKSYCFYCYISPRKCLAKAKFIISKLQQTFCMG